MWCVICSVHVIQCVFWGFNVSVLRLQAHESPGSAGWGSCEGADGVSTCWKERFKPQKQRWMDMATLPKRELFRRWPSWGARSWEVVCPTRQTAQNQKGLSLEATKLISIRGWANGCQWKIPLMEQSSASAGMCVCVCETFKMSW